MKEAGKMCRRQEPRGRRQCKEGRREEARRIEEAGGKGQDARGGGKGKEARNSRKGPGGRRQVE